MARLAGIIVLMVAATYLLAHFVGVACGALWAWWIHQEDIAREPQLVPIGLSGQPWLGVTVLAISGGLWIWLWRKAFEDGRRVPVAAIGCAAMFIAVAGYGWHTFTLM